MSKAQLEKVCTALASISSDVAESRLYFAFNVQNTTFLFVVLFFFFFFFLQSPGQGCIAVLV